MTNRLFALVAIALAFLAFATGEASADKRKRVVVLDFEGPKAEKFQEDVVKLLKKNHTVLSTEKWNSTAEELEASKLTEKNIKKVAKKLKIDGVIEGKIEKRRDEYIIKLKLRGKDGDIVGKVDTKADSTKLEGSALKDVKNELLPAVEGLEANHSSGGGGDEEADSPPKKKKGGDEADEPNETKKKKGGDEESDEPVKKKSGFGKKKGGDEEADEPKEMKKKKGGGDEEADEPKELKKKKGGGDDEEATEEDEGDEPKKSSKKKRSAKRGDDEEGGEVDEGTGDEEEPSGSMLSVGERAVDIVGGLSVMARRLNFTYSADLGKKPPGYKGVPVAGVMVDATIYPLAVSHKRSDMLKNLGLNLMVDKVVKISSQVRLPDGTVPKLATSTMRYSLGAVFRYPFNKTPTSPVIGASLNFGGHSFTIDKNDQADIPNVAYTIVDPKVFFRYPASEKFVLNLDLGVMLFTDTGQIQTPASYGGASVTGVEGEISGDYMVAKNLFARAAFRFETIGFKFDGKGVQASMRDTDMAQDVFGARDSFIGGAVTLGYVY